jgi:phage tail P2-like protein
MSLDASLIPPSASALERDIGALAAALDAIDTAAIETLWDAWACPSAVLPYLAAALSVDLWDDGWNEVRRRQAVADSPNWHRFKGTRAALRAAVELVCGRALIIEWFERAPRGRRGTAEVVAEPVAGADALSTLADARRMTGLAKPKSRAVAVAVGIIADAAGPIATSCGALASIVIAPLPILWGPPVANPMTSTAQHSSATLRLAPRSS